MKSPKKGFTLIELLVVLAIMGVLVSIAYPNYQQYLEKSRRTDGKSALMDLANRLEHYYSEHQTYESATIGQNPETDVLASVDSPDHYYQLSIVSQDNQGFVIQATPQQPQTQDTQCQSFTLNSMGEKGIVSGPMGEPSGNIAVCW